MDRTHLRARLRGALASLAATLGSAKEISRLRLCFEHVTFESSLAPYAPGDDPWQITATSPEAEARIAKALENFAFVPSRFEGLMAAYHQALESNGPLPVTLDDARRSLELIIHYCTQQKLIPRAFAVDELFDDVTRALT